MSKVKERIIIGIDPGTTVLGYGILKCRGNQVTMIDAGCVKMKPGSDHGVRLKRIFDELSKLIALHLPDEMAIEAPFYGKNVQSMLKLGRAQGVAIASALSRGIPYQEYAPRRVKQAVTGKGGASKEQVAGMMQSILAPSELPKEHDATDGLAVAFCHHISRQSDDFTGQNSSSKAIKKSNKKGNWARFVATNSDRVN